MSVRIGMGTRIRKSPYFEAVVEAGVTHLSVYNHTYLPLSFGDPLAEYWRLINDVTMWDVTCQRQIQLAGPDANKLAQLVSARDLSKAKVGQGKYVPMVDHAGKLINDPLMLKVDHDRWWVSIADGGILPWCRAVAGERGLDVAVDELTIAPLAVQGPKAEDVLVRLAGEWVRELRFFWYREAELPTDDGDPISVWIGRAGWSKQGGFEIYLLDESRGLELWNLVKDAGAPFNIGPGGPNSVERIESGLLSFRSDTDDDTDPFEAGLGRWVDLDANIDFIGREALIERAARGKRYELVGLRFAGHAVTGNEDLWPVTIGGNRVGTVRAAAHSPRLGCNIATAMIDVPHNVAGTVVTVHGTDTTYSGEVASLPLL